MPVVLDDAEAAPVAVVRTPSIDDPDALNVAAITRAIVLFPAAEAVSGGGTSVGTPTWY